MVAGRWRAGGERRNSVGTLAFFNKRYVLGYGAFFYWHSVVFLCTWCSWYSCIWHMGALCLQQKVQSVSSPHYYFLVPRKIKKNKTVEYMCLSVILCFGFFVSSYWSVAVSFHGNCIIISLPWAIYIHFNEKISHKLISFNPCIKNTN